MSTIERTAYPRYSSRRKIKSQELDNFYRLNSSEIRLMKKHARSDQYRLSFAIQLKTFQNLGYFIPLDNVPDEIINYIRKTSKFHYTQKYGYKKYKGDFSKALYNHREIIRKHMNITRWGKLENNGRHINLGLKSAVKLSYEISHSMNNIPDIINAVIESMIENNYELPSFYSLNRLVRHTRHLVNNKIFQQVFNRVNAQLDNRNKITELLKCQGDSYFSLFNNLKTQPQKLTKQNVYKFIEHSKWLDSLGNSNDYLDGIAQIKIEQFAEEAKILTIDEIKKMNIAKQYTYILSLVYLSKSNSLDAIANMLCKLVATGYKHAQDELEKKADENKDNSSHIASLLKSIVERSVDIKNPNIYAKWITDLISKSGGPEHIANKCNDVILTCGSESRVFLSKVLLNNQQNMFHTLIDTIDPQSSNNNKSLTDAIKFIQKNRTATREYFDQKIDLSFTVEFWKNRILKKINGRYKMNRKELITSVLDALVKGLNSGDVYVKGARNYSDYRAGLLPWDECLKYIDDYCNHLDLPSSPDDMFDYLNKKLIEKASNVDNDYLNNPAFTIDSSGRPILKKYDAKPILESAEKLESILKSRMPEHNLLDLLSNAEYYVEWTQECTSPQGYDVKLDSPIEKFILTTLSQGTGLGVTQTAKHIRGNISPRILSRVNQKHFSVKSLNKSIVRLVNFINEFPLIKAWGTGESCAADGTLEEIHDNNMVAEHHIRYGKKGGIAYHHVADNYIALFSTFIQCGVWEAIHIIDGLMKNASEVQPRIIHADTQGQSLPVFAFAYLFGIQLMPRIRNWKELKIYRQTKDSAYKNIDSLFCDSAINWDLIKLHWKDLMQVVLSVKYGKISSSFILSKLNSYNYKNKLYKAFQELGKVLRTIYLLDFMNDIELRQKVTDTTNKAESYNKLSDWIRFGSKKLVATNNPDEMEKSIKYNQLIANSIILQNVVDMSNILYELKQEGYSYTAEDLSYLSPYLTEHIKRFGELVLDLNTIPEKVDHIRDRELF
ncbi:TnpA family transposase [Allofrancisella inopinata]|uniref:Tn3 family transposase n=1 Tax=Allofrancisella inopinata TaxID=1085647 RepID=A0AAE6YHL4_9GAMM|nr:Tn3 family transposase [Allofrancisella inopinata]QIV96013.1 Tn3 family transposase [Allofrancisella inopinata]TDT67379.1 TnpA family transposase [Allofrancisella inopinata]